jgi:G3E family GTPase
MVELVNLIPVTILTGYLGSGKTTFLNYLLKEQHGYKFAIIENEFGDVGIDDALVFQSQDEIIEMMNGCVCCTVRGDIIITIQKLIKERAGQFSHIIIETTGLADPAPVAQTFFVDEEVKKLCRLDSIVTFIDSKFTGQHLDEVKPEGVENEAHE